MLTLDQTTLFYFSLRDCSSGTKDRHVGSFEEWASKMLKGTKPASSHNYATPSLTAGSTQPSHPPPSTQSALTNNVKISHYDDNGEVIDSGFPDLDKTKGSEREAAINSPLKGKCRISSSVSHQL